MMEKRGGKTLWNAYGNAGKNAAKKRGDGTREKTPMVHAENTH